MPVLAPEWRRRTTNTSKGWSWGSLPMDQGLGSLWKMGRCKFQTSSVLRGGRRVRGGKTGRMCSLSLPLLGTVLVSLVLASFLKWGQFVLDLMDLWSQ